MSGEWHGRPKVGYMVNLNAATVNPADASTYFFGDAANAAPSVSAGFFTVPVSKAGIIRGAAVRTVIAGTLGSSEAHSYHVRNYDQNTVALIVSTATSTGVTNIFLNTAMALPVAAGESLQIRWTTPTWATNPTSVFHMATIYIE